MKNFHAYASLKTTGQLVLDVGSVTTHVAGLVHAMEYINHPPVQLLIWFLFGTIIFQVSV